MIASPTLAAARAGCLAAEYERVRQTTMRLAEPLSAEDAALQSMPYASPAKWHLAHTSWFMEEFVLRPARGSSFVPFAAGYRELFNSYYQQVGEQWPRDRRGLLSRPSLDTVRDYRAWIDTGVLELIADPARAAAWSERIELGLHHEQQHQELLLTDIKHLFALNPIAPIYRPAPSLVRDHDTNTQVSMVDIDGGPHSIGARPEGFAFDAERPRHRVWLEPYALADRLVTNAEYREFIDDGGYERPELWLSDGWLARRQQGWSGPLYWNTHDSTLHFTLHGLRPVDPFAPVTHVSLYEADAYARWRGLRLPTEAEWEAAAMLESGPGSPPDDDLLEPAPAGPSEGSRLRQMYGVAWQWTTSAFSPYPGFKPLTGALGEYNGKFMANQYVLRGSSCATPHGHSRPTYRNFFNADARWQFTGIRLAKDRNE